MELYASIIMTQRLLCASLMFFSNTGDVSTPTQDNNRAQRTRRMYTCCFVTLYSTSFQPVRDAEQLLRALYLKDRNRGTLLCMRSPLSCFTVKKQQYRVTALQILRQKKYFNRNNAKRLLFNTLWITGQSCKTSQLS